MSLLSILAGLVCGLLSGLGVGGGSLLLLWMTAVDGLPQAQAQGLNLLFFLPTAAIALLLHAKHRFLRWRFVLPAALAGCTVGGLTAFLTADLDRALLHRAFGCFLLVVGAIELFRKPRPSECSGATGYRPSAPTP